MNRPDYTKPDAKTADQDRDAAETDLAYLQRDLAMLRLEKTTRDAYTAARASEQPAPAAASTMSSSVPEVAPATTRER